MVKGKYLLKDEVVLQHPLLLFLFLVLGFIIMDPFELSPVGGHDFRPVKNVIAPYNQVMKNWPGDNNSRLACGDQVFVDEVFGPESLEFDINGHGPYAGLADGRIVRWMGHNTGGWETFAFVSREWYVLLQFGLLVVGPEGGYATPLATEVAGKPILFANDLDIHHNGD